MSYLKPWKVCQDYALGILNVNLANSNNVSQRTLWYAEHAAGGARQPYQGFGMHDTPPIPRTIIRAKPQGLPGGISIDATFDAPNGVTLGVQHISTGTWQISFAPDLRLFFGNPRPAQTGSSSVRTCSAVGSVTTGPQTLINIKTYELNTGDFVLTDYEWSAAVYSYV